jgi:hypothetical protein
VGNLGKKDDLVAVFVDFNCWETFDDNIEGFRDLFIGALTLQSLASGELFYPMRYVPEDEDRLGALYEWIFGTAAAADDSSLSLMREIFAAAGEPGRHVQLLQMPPAAYLVTLLHVGLVRINVTGSREVRYRLPGHPLACRPCSYQCHGSRAQER